MTKKPAVNSTPATEATESQSKGSVFPLVRKSRPRIAAAGCVALGLAMVSGQALLAQDETPGQSSSPTAASTPVLSSGGVSAAATRPDTSAQQVSVDRSNAYYHLSLAHIYEEMATTYGRSEYATRAIEEYKLALNADPSSAFLNNGLAELYFKTGRVREAVEAAEDQIKKNPNNLEAHKLLGRVYLRSLGDGQNTGPNQKMLDLAISEYKKIVELQPKDIESRLLLGKLYSVDHNSVKAEEQFKAAQQIDPSSEEVVLNLAQLYGESGDLKRAADVLKAVPAEDRTSKIEYALGVTYDQLKDPKNAAAAYQEAVDLEPDNLDAERGLAQALLNNGQLEESLKLYRDIAAGDPQDAQTLLRISEIERRQGKYEASLATLKKAKALVPDSLEIGYNEALLYDALGRYDDSAQELEKLVEQVTHANGAYSEQEKSNRAVFLERLGNVYNEQNKTEEAISAYQKMIDLGGEYAVRGYQGQVDVYRDARMYKEATEVGEKAVQALPKDRSLKLMLAGQLADTGRADDGIRMAKALLNGTESDREVYMALAQINTRLKRWKDAEDTLAKAEPMAKKPDDKIYILFLRGTINERQKRYDAAEEEFQKILAMDPDNSMTLNYLGYMLADRGVRLNESVKMLRKAVELDPQNGAYLDSLGWAYFKQGQYELAEDNLRKAVERMSTDPTVHDHLGELYEKTGRVRLAAAQWELSLAEYARTVPADVEQSDVSKVQKKLESARVKLAKQESRVGADKP